MHVFVCACFMLHYTVLTSTGFAILLQTIWLNRFNAYRFLQLHILIHVFVVAEENQKCSVWLLLVTLQINVTWVPGREPERDKRKTLNVGQARAGVVVAIW